MNTEVFVIGVGMHPFGRTPGLSGVEQGAIAAQRAIADAGIKWKDVNVAYGGSYSSGLADSLCGPLGLTGIPFVNVFNGCATGATCLMSAMSAIRSGMADIALAVGFDKHAPGAFTAQPENYGLPAWYGEAGFMLTPQ